MEQDELRVRVNKALAPILRSIAKEDPYDVIAQAGWLTEALREPSAQAATLRRQAVRVLRAEGHTLRDIAKETGLTSGRIAQIETGYDRGEQRVRVANR
jgi:DNA-directed RNA polymerase sigma subunit (sigma70/sigma32)